MTAYNVRIDKILKSGLTGDKTEIWARITNLETSETMDKLIWWEDENGLFHDETSNLPAELRSIIDNAWIEKSRRW
ncbi:MAG: hypothetical protein DRN12_07695 [Thermoplasmata archaeon]|nr:MAG: hypothetical protein DRN12_07695 [Thermoplasmata archaeon]